VREPLTWDKAASHLGWTGKGRARRLKRLVLSREKSTGKRIATRIGTRTRPAYKLSLSALRRHLPELFRSKVEDLADNLKSYLAEIDDRIAAGAAEHVAEYVEPRLDELWQRDEQIAHQVGEIATRLASMAKLLKVPAVNDRDRPRSTTQKPG
jgi:hypothetical protein